MKDVGDATIWVENYFAQRARAPDAGTQPRASERYTRGKALGQGGMGTVLLAEDTALARTVAMKVLRLDSDENRLLLAREAGIAGRLEHPNIVPLYDAGVDADGHAFLTMRFVEGETLAAIIRRLVAGDAATHHQYNLPARCRIVLQLLSALELAHARGIIHRDIKPDNVMIGPFGEVFLVDWGIAGPPEEAPPSEIVGTPRYMSPEQGAGSAPLDLRSDLYSLSVLFYELLTLLHPLGELPESTGAKLEALARRTPTPAEDVRARHQPVVPRALSLLVMKGLERDRAARWASAREMADAIDEFLAGNARVVCPHTAYARGLTIIGRVLDAAPRLVYLATGIVIALAAFGATTLVSTVWVTFTSQP